MNKNDELNICMLCSEPIDEDFKTSSVICHKCRKERSKEIEKSRRNARNIWNEANPDNKTIPGDGFLIHHIDGNPLNNSLDNLIKMLWGEHTTIHNLGRKMSDDAKIRISIANKGNKKWLGRKHSQESKDKISKAKTGKIYGKRDPKIGRKISESLKKKWENETHYLVGRKHSQETKDKISAANRERYEKNISD